MDQSADRRWIIWVQEHGKPETRLYLSWGNIHGASPWVSDRAKASVMTREEMGCTVVHSRAGNTTYQSGFEEIEQP